MIYLLFRVSRKMFRYFQEITNPELHSLSSGVISGNRRSALVCLCVCECVCNVVAKNAPARSLSANRAPRRRELCVTFVFIGLLRSFWPNKNACVGSHVRGQRDTHFRSITCVSLLNISNPPHRGHAWSVVTRFVVCSSTGKADLRRAANGFVMLAASLRFVQSFVNRRQFRINQTQHVFTDLTIRLYFTYMHIFNIDVKVLVLQHVSVCVCAREPVQCYVNAWE